MKEEDYFELLGRLVVSYLNGVILGHDTPLEEYIQRAPPEVRDRVKDVLEPLSRVIEKKKE